MVASWPAINTNAIAVVGLDAILVEHGDLTAPDAARWDFLPVPPYFPAPGDMAIATATS
jgi:hypothetical protein